MLVSRLRYNDEGGAESVRQSWSGAGRSLRLLVALSLTSILSLAALAQDTRYREVSVSPDKPTQSGTWRYRQLQDDTLVVCRYNGPKECVTHELRVENDSGETLECESRMTYDGVNNENLSSMTALRVVLPKQSRNVMNDRAKPAVSLTAATVDCHARAQRPRLNVAKECSFQVLDAPPLQAFYPAAARRLSEEGPVDLQFTLEKTRGHASAISVVGSSLSDRLDNAALKYVENLTFNSPCPPMRYELRVSFKLEE